MLIDALTRECHVWFIDPDAEFGSATLDACEALLSSEELARLRRFRFAADRQRFLVSHALVRRTLSKYSDIPPQDWSFVLSGHGKPEIANPEAPPLRFNLTHTRGLAACMVAMDGDCGIDAEHLGNRHDPAAIARKMFSPTEYAQLLELRDNQRLRYFYRHWTLREAYVKANGTGISFPTGKLVFETDDGNGVVAHFDPDVNDHPGHWQFGILDISDRHLVATALDIEKCGEKPVVANRFVLD